ncbi:hypothetical protein ACWFR5_38165 [Streptomyces sp. NPDC055092]
MGLDLRATTINAAIAALVRDAGDPGIDDRVRTLRTELDVAGLTSTTPTLYVAHAFHQAVLDDQDALAATIERLREQTRGGAYAYYVDIAHFMAALPRPQHTRQRIGRRLHNGRERSLQMRGRQAVPVRHHYPVGRARAHRADPPHTSPPTAATAPGTTASESPHHPGCSRAHP